METRKPQNIIILISSPAGELSIASEARPLNPVWRLPGQPDGRRSFTYRLVRNEYPNPSGHRIRRRSNARNVRGRPCSSHVKANDPVSRSRKGYDNTGMAMSKCRGCVEGKNVSENFSRRGFVRAIRIAPDERDSPPGYLTMVKWRTRSLGKPRIILAKESCRRRCKNNSERKMHHMAYQLERRFVPTRKFEMSEMRA